VSWLAFSPDGKTLASASWDNTAKLWDVGTGKESATLEGHSKRVEALAFSPDGKTLATGGGDTTICLWDVVGGKRTTTLTRNGGSVKLLAFSPDGKTLVSWDTTSHVVFWDLGTNKEKAALTMGLLEARFDADGKAFGIGGRAGSISVWDLTDGKELGSFKPGDGYTTGVGWATFSPDLKTIASTGDHLVRLHNATSGNEVTTFTYPEKEQLTCVTFSPDGQTLATVTQERASHAKVTIHLADVASGKEWATLTGHAKEISHLAFSPDGRTLASGSFDNTIKLWTIPANPKPQK
jgi:WD40 repeat protein